MKGNGRLYRRGNVWWIDYGFRGRRYRESAGSTRKAEALALLRRRLEEMGRGRLVGPSAEKVTLDDLARLLLDDYDANGRRSAKRVELAVRALKDFFSGYTRALDISTDRINRYIAHRRDSDGVQPATIQKELAALKRAFNLAVKAGLLEHVPHVPSLQVRNTRTGFFERGDFEAIVQQLPEYLRAPMRFGYLTGWRVQSEVLPLTWAQVDFDAGTVRLEPETTKNREGRTFPFAALPELEALVQGQRERTRAVEGATSRIVPWVFHRDGERIVGYKRAWQSTCKRAGVPGAWVHDLRRSAVRNLVRAGVPEIVAMRLCGHKTRAVFDRYAIVNEEMLREGVEKLARRSAAAVERKVRSLAQRAEG
ncbi:MAG: tyrosine-type recombinase/integrase [Gemmatimonadetes bacterium]|nr:tyrosine-type recombinase/integrase [Gemmatimonadota bacterium]